MKFSPITLHTKIDMRNFDRIPPLEKFRPISTKSANPLKLCDLIFAKKEMANCIKEELLSDSEHPKIVSPLFSPITNALLSSFGTYLNYNMNNLESYFNLIEKINKKMSESNGDGTPIQLSDLGPFLFEVYQNMVAAVNNRLVRMKIDYPRWYRNNPSIRTDVKSYALPDLNHLTGELDLIYNACKSIENDYSGEVIKHAILSLKVIADVTSLRSGAYEYSYHMD